MKTLSSIYHEIHKSLQNFPQSQESCTNRLVGPLLRSVLAALQRQNVSGVTEAYRKATFTVPGILIRGRPKNIMLKLDFERKIAIRQVKESKRYLLKQEGGGWLKNACND